MITYVPGRLSPRTRARLDALITRRLAAMEANGWPRGRAFRALVLILDATGHRRVVAYLKWRSAMIVGGPVWWPSSGRAKRGSISSSKRPKSAGFRQRLGRFGAALLADEVIGED